MQDTRPPRARNGVVPLGSLFVVLLAVLFSLLFIFTISLAFVGVANKNFFLKRLEGLASEGDGIVLLGESVDVDIDEPQVTVRWTIVACGSQYVMSDSPPIHGSRSCGMPSMNLEVFVDSSLDPVALYNPSTIPLDMKTGQRRIIQNLLQFDSDHVLDVHTTRLYPFDTYSLSTSLRVAVPRSNQTQAHDIPFLGVSIVDQAITFSIDTFSTPTSENITATLSENRQVSESDEPLEPTLASSRYVELLIRRPASDRIYSLLLFGVNWLLSHFNFGVVLMATCRGKLKIRAKATGASSGNEGLSAEQGENKRMRTIRKIIEQRRARIAATHGIHVPGENVANTNPPTTTTETRPMVNTLVVRRYNTSKDSLKLLAGVLAVILVIPQLRDAMPDPPGFDGVLIDAIGFFPQMALAGASAIFLLLITVKRELDHSNSSSSYADAQVGKENDTESSRGKEVDDNEDEYGFQLPKAFMSFGMPRGFHSRQLTRS